MAAFAAAIAAVHSATLEISRPGSHVAPSVVRTWYTADEGGGGEGEGGGRPAAAAEPRQSLSREQNLPELYAVFKQQQ